MHPKVLLDTATELTRRVLRLEHPADAVVSRFFREHRGLGPRERTTLAETVYAVLRRKPLYEHLARSGSGGRERRLAVLGFATPREFLAQALTAGEQAWLSACDAVPPAELLPAHRHNLPSWLAERLQAQLGAAEFDVLAAALLTSAPLDLRVNTLLAKREQVAQELKTAGIVAAATPYSPWGLRIEGKPALNRLDLFNRGALEVQDEGSQLLALLLDARRGLSNVHPVVIAHERDERVKRLAGKLERVLVDAPCSGLGTLRRNPDLKWRQSPQDVQELAVKQQAILTGAARLVKPGGRLVYATCSLLPDENEAVAQLFSAAQPDFALLNAAELLEVLKVPAAATLTTAAGHLRLWPHRHGTDGFFAAVWQRKA